MTDTRPVNDESSPTSSSPATETSRLNSMVLGDTKIDEGREDVTNIPALAALAGLFAWLWFLNPVYFLTVVGLVVMIFLHELGHYMTARWTGMKATQFFIGFGPTLFSRQRGEVEWGIKAIPAGAFVRIIGMNNLDPVPAADESRTYRHATFPRRMLVITAGSIMHFIQAILLFTLGLSVIGNFDIDSEDWTVGQISRLETGETPSVEAGIQLGDRLVSVDGVELVDWVSAVETIQALPGETVALEVERDGAVQVTEVTLAELPRDDGSVVGYLGVSPAFPRAQQGPFAGVEAAYDLGKQAIVAIPRFFSPSSLANLGSLVLEGGQQVSFDDEEVEERPISLVGAVRIAGSVAETDWANPILLLAGVNMFIGVLNLMPLLPLDGGHAAIAIYERIRTRDRKRPYRADVEKLLPFTYAVVAVFAFMGLTTIWLDIVRPIG